VPALHVATKTAFGMIELYECARMHARISMAACKTNRAQDMVSCMGCKGLGTASTINLEDSRMGVSLCNIKGCNKAQVMKGFCTGHAREEGHGELIDAHYKKVNAAIKAKKQANVKELIDAAHTPIATRSVAAPMITAVELILTDISMELDELFLTKRNEWLEDLHGATTIRSRAQMFLSMADSLEGLVY
jgi:hypothetical protein